MYIVCIIECVFGAMSEVLRYYHQQGITVVKATLLFDCLPPDARPPAAAPTSGLLLQHSSSLSSVFILLQHCML